MSDHRELFWSCVKNYDSPFFLFVLLFVCCAIMFIFFYVNQNYLGLTFLHPDTNESDFLCPIQILKHMRHLHYVHVGCYYWSYTDSRIFFHFSVSSDCKDSIARSCRASFRVYRSRCLGIKSALVCFCATDSLQGLWIPIRNYLY